MSLPDSGDVALAHATLLLDELVRGGVGHACMTPGSRSTPLVLAAARNQDVTLHVNVDERSSAYFALGVAKASGLPAVAICTSGTAVANHFPAVVEAFMARVPLIVITADRPPELHGVGANQTIDQQQIYGRFVRWFCDLGVPEPGAATADTWRSAGARAIQVSLGDPQGPVHLNAPFREPLLPGGHPPAFTALSPPAERAVARPPAAAATGALVRELAGVSRAVVVAGALRTPPAALADLCRERGWPLLAEPTSGLRVPAGAGQGPGALRAGALLAADRRFRGEHLPEAVLQVGAAPTSRGVQALMGEAARLIILDPDRVVADPERRARLTVEGDAGACVAALRAAPGVRRHDPAWPAGWGEADRSARQGVDALLDSWDEPFEGRVARDVAAAIPDGGLLFAGSSMPVRDLDQYMAPRGGVRVLANRGASGIDGSVSTALGIAEGGAPTYALLGDLALLHDAAGLLWMARRARAAVLVVVDNDGGGIFSLLPQARLPREEFELLFGTPHGLDIEALARVAGAGVRTVDSARVLLPALREAAAAGGVQVVRVRVDRARAVALRAEVAAAVASRLHG